MHAQCEQKVYVCQYNGQKEKTPLANVEVVVTNSGTTVSDAKGMCVLKFRTLKPGDKVSIRRISKPGYEVFNNEALEQWYISRDGGVFTIVLCKQEDLAKLRNQYLKAANTGLQKDLVKQEHVINKDLKQGNITQSEYEKKLAEARNEYESKLLDVDNYVDRWVHADLSKINDTERKVLNLIKQGKILEALSEYESTDLLNEYSQERESIEKLSEAEKTLQEKLSEAEEMRLRLYQTALRQNTLLRIAGGEENIEKGFKLLKDFAYADTTYYLPLLEYGHYCMQSDRYTEAQQAFDICLNAKDTATLVKANMYNLKLKNKQKKYQEVIDEAEKLYDYCKTQSELKHSPAIYLEERTYIITTLMSSMISVKDTIGTEKYIEPMLKEHIEMLALKQDTESRRAYVEALSCAYRAMHNLYLKSRSEEAYNYLNTAIAIQEELYAEDPVKQAAMLGYLHSCYASHTRMIDSKNYELADREYKLSFEYYAEAYKKNPGAYARFVAQNSLNHAAMFVFNNKENYQKALPILQRTEEYLHKGALINPTVMTPYYGFYERCLGNYYNLNDEGEKALEHFEQATDYYRKAYEENKASLYKDLMSAYDDLIKILAALYESDQIKYGERIKAVKEEMIQLAKENNKPIPKFNIDL